jgi:hypothetical protein
MRRSLTTVNYGEGTETSVGDGRHGMQTGSIHGEQTPPSIRTVEETAAREGVKPTGLRGRRSLSVPLAGLVTCPGPRNSGALVARTVSGVRDNL